MARRHRQPKPPKHPKSPKHRAGGTGTHARTRQPRKPRPPDVPSTARVTVGETFGRGTPTGRGHTVGGGARALELAAPAGPGLVDIVLELVGEEQLSLRSSLALWQREQDRTLNRAWRRPGGLARLAGL